MTPLFRKTRPLSCVGLARRHNNKKPHNNNLYNNNQNSNNNNNNNFACSAVAVDVADRLALLQQAALLPFAD